MSAKRRIVIADPHPPWAHQFEELAGALKSALGPLALAIEHVGSTSVPVCPPNPSWTSMSSSTRQINCLPWPKHLVRSATGILGTSALPGEKRSRVMVPRCQRMAREPFGHNLYVCAQVSGGTGQASCLSQRTAGASGCGTGLCPRQTRPCRSIRRRCLRLRRSQGILCRGGPAIRSRRRRIRSRRGSRPDGPGNPGLLLPRSRSGTMLGRQWQLEFARIQELTRRFLHEPPAVELDVGGGPGTHAKWLAADGTRFI